MSSYGTVRTMLVVWAVAGSPQGAAKVNVPNAAEGGFGEVVEKALPSVVRVMVTTTGPRGKAGGEGAGVVISSDGYLLTNRHVVEGATKITVQFGDDRELEAKQTAGDPATDLAVLKVDAKGLHPVTFGDSGHVRIGDYALAIGNPFGVGTTVTLGIVSAKGEGDYIQTDAAINPGNSGGPLLNTKGELIGINTAIVSPSGGSSGVGFALPSNLARTVSSDLIAKGKVDRGYLGAGLQPMTEALQEALGVRRGGAVISDVAAGSPAAGAGLQKGDVLVAINGRVLRDFRRLQLYAAQAKPDTTVEFTIARQEREVVVPVRLAARPAASAAAFQLEEVIPGAMLADAGNEGAVVAAVDPQGIGAQAGLAAGDLIVAVDRKAVAGVATVREQLGLSKGKPALVEVSRAGATYFIAVPR